MARIEGILFDLGDTLIDFGPIDTIEIFEQGARSTYEYLRELGEPVPPFGQYHRGQLRAIRLAYLVSRVTRREFNSADILGRLSLGWGQQLSPAQLEHLTWLWYKPLHDRATVEPGLPDVLAGLRDRGVRLGIISNTFIPGHILDRHLDEEGLLDFFPDRIYSCDVRYRKPNGRIFRLALEQLDLTASATLFVGDTLTADILGANRAGLISVLKDPAGTRYHRRIRPRHRIARLAELPAIVDEYA